LVGKHKELCSVAACFEHSIELSGFIKGRIYFLFSKRPLISKEKL